MNPFDLSTEDIMALADEYGTPLYVVSRRQIAANYRRLDAVLPAAQLFYAVKANPHPEILATLARIGAGFDVASRGEILAALAAGANPAKDLIFADTVKDPRQITFAAGIGLDDFTFDNACELGRIASLAPGANVHVRLAVSNQGSVAHLSDKFGAQPEDAVALLCQAKDAGLVPLGISFHVGSQCLDTSQYLRALAVTRQVFDEAAAAGIHLTTVDIGGGFPVSYNEEPIDIPALGRAITLSFGSLFDNDVNLVAEPGRAVVGDAVCLVTKVISESVRGGRNWLYCDDGTYGSFLEVLLYRMRFPLKSTTEGPLRSYVLAGPTCDSIDVFSRDAEGQVCTVDLPEMHIDDLLVAGSMGAYSYSESTRFNGFEPPHFAFID